MMEFFLLPFKFWLAFLETASGSDNAIDTNGLRRNKKQEMMRQYPEAFDKDENFIGWHR